MGDHLERVVNESEKFSVRVCTGSLGFFGEVETVARRSKLPYLYKFIGFPEPAIFFSILVEHNNLIAHNEAHPHPSQRHARS